MEAIYTTLDTLYSLTAIAGLAYLAYEFVAGLLNRQHPTDTPTELTAPPQAEDWELPPPELHPDPYDWTDYQQGEEPTPSPKSAGAMAIDWSTMGIVQLRRECLTRGLKGAGRWNKAKCLAALSR